MDLTRRMSRDFPRLILQNSIKLHETLVKNNYGRQKVQVYFELYFVRVLISILKRWKKF